MSTSGSIGGSKCLKNLDIVMESADEGQALLSASTTIHHNYHHRHHHNQRQQHLTEKHKNGGEAEEEEAIVTAHFMAMGASDGHGPPPFCHENGVGGEQKKQKSGGGVLHSQQQQQQHALTKMKTTTNPICASEDDGDDIDDNKLTPTALKAGRRKAGSNNNQHQQPSRVQRSRLSVITFLNNITAPAATRTEGSGKSFRSLSVSSAAFPFAAAAVHHQEQQNLQTTPSAPPSDNKMVATSTTNDERGVVDEQLQCDGGKGGGGGHRLSTTLRSLCGSGGGGDSGGGCANTTGEQHQQQQHCGAGGDHPILVMDRSNTTNNGGCISQYSAGGGMVPALACVGGSMTTSVCAAAAADKLSIKSGASSTTTASSSGGHTSESHSISGGNLCVAGGGATGGNKQFKLRECPVCYMRQHPSNFHKLQTCAHLTCKTCLVKYLNLEIMESRTNISCPSCTALLHASDIHALLECQPSLLDRYEMFALRRALSTDPDARWCPAPDCTYAVIAYSCAACPQLQCERCNTMFCYHCKNNWHPSQTCDQARAKLLSADSSGGGLRAFGAQAAALLTAETAPTTSGDVTKACPRCGVPIMKMNDGSCNHMQCVLCSAEFCWLCLKQINELHYLSPTGCTFWGKKPWTRKKKLLWQVGTLIGAPLGIALIAGLAVPGIICGVPIFVGRKTYQRFANLSKTKRRLVTVLGVCGSLIVSPVLAVLTVGVGVPIMLAYVYGVVPLSLCRNGGCGGGGGNASTVNNDDELFNGVSSSDFDAAYGEGVVLQQHFSGGGDKGSSTDGGGDKRTTTKSRQQREEEKTSNKSSFHHRRQSIASSGLVSLTDKVNTEDASIQAIAGSQYNFDNRSVHTVWSSGQYAAQLSAGAVELAQEATSYNNEDAENSSTLACCSASIVAQSSERRSLTGSSGSIRHVRPRSSISNSRANSEEKSKFLRKMSSRNCKDQQGNAAAVTASEGGDNITTDQQQQQHLTRRSSSPFTAKQRNAAASPSLVISPSAVVPRGADIPNSTNDHNPSSPTAAGRRRRSRLSLRSFLRHPVNSIFGTKTAGVKS